MTESYWSFATYQGTLADGTQRYGYGTEDQADAYRAHLAATSDATRIVWTVTKITDARWAQIKAEGAEIAVALLKYELTGIEIEASGMTADEVMGEALATERAAYRAHLLAQTDNPEESTMTKITQTVRTSIRTILDRSREYDAATMRIGADGVVTACKDADKTFAGNDPARYVVGRVNDMVTPDGTIREGF